MATKPSPTESQEYIAICKSTSVLIDLVKASPTTIATSLFSNGYLSQYQYDLIGPTSKMSDIEKAQILVTAMTDRVKALPANFHVLLAVLNKEGSWVECYLDEIEENYRIVNEQLISEDCSDTDSYYSATDGETSSNDNIEKELDSPSAATGFVSPFCSKCSVKTFFSEGGCPHATEQVDSDSKLRFPYLDCLSLNPEEKEILETRLIDDTKEIVTQFADMEDSLIVSLQSQLLDPKRVVNYALNLITKLEMNKEKRQLKNAKSVSEVFIALHPFKSFLHYEIVESIVQKFGSLSDRQLMETYISKFNKFCERSVFEVPSNIFHHSHPKPAGDKVFSVFFTPEEYARLGDVVAVRRKLAKILGVSLHCLRLYKIEKGSVRLSFLIPRKIEKKIFPLSQEKIRALEEVHIIVQPSDEPTDQSQINSPGKDFQEFGGRPNLFAAIEGGHTKVAKLLIENGADVNEINKFSQSPLFAASERGHTEIAQLLIDKGADLNKCDSEGRLPLLAATKSGHTETAQLLIENGANKYWKSQTRGSSSTSRNQSFLQVRSAPTSPSSRLLSGHSSLKPKLVSGSPSSYSMTGASFPRDRTRLSELQPWSSEIGLTRAESGYGSTMSDLRYGSSELGPTNPPVMDYGLKDDHPLRSSHQITVPSEPTSQNSFSSLPRLQATVVDEGIEDEYLHIS